MATLQPPPSVQPTTVYAPPRTAINLSVSLPSTNRFTFFFFIVKSPWHAYMYRMGAKFPGRFGLGGDCGDEAQ